MIMMIMMMMMIMIIVTMIMNKTTYCCELNNGISLNNELVGTWMDG